MPPTREAFAQIEAFFAVALRLARTAPSGRFALARLADAIDPAWIPQPEGDWFAAELQSARAEARTPIDRRTVERELRSAWGGKVSDELEDFDPEPASVRAAFQLHRGQLDGRQVAVKILRPGLAASVRQDLALLDGLLGPLGAAFPEIDARALLHEVRERVLEELDLEHEATVQRRFHRALRDHPFLVIPAPHTALARENVAVSEWLEGSALTDAADPDEAAARLLVFVLGALRFGQAYADPDIEDVAVLRDGRLAILAFGATREADAGRVDLATDAVEAFAADDSEAFSTAVAGLGVLPAGEVPGVLHFIREVLGEHARPGRSRLDAEAVVAVRDRALAHPALPGLLIRGRLVPEDLWPVRGIGQAFGVIARTGASGDWLALVRAALREGWQAFAS